MNYFLRLTSIVVLSVFLSTAAWSSGMTLQDIAKLEQIGQISVSPSGAHTAITKIIPREVGVDDDGGSYSELHVIQPDGDITPFVTGQVNIGNIGWTPDGQHITFTTKRDSDQYPTIYRIALSGGEAQAMIKPEGSVRGYSFAPDGRFVAVITAPPESKERKAEKEMGFSQIIFEEEWRANQLTIHNLEEDSFENIDLDGSVQQVRWSPAGDRLAISITPRQLVDDTLMFKRIRIISPEGETLGRVENPGKLGDMVWSPDGDHLAFIGTSLVRDPREGRLMVTSSTGGVYEELMENLQGHVWYIEWHQEKIGFISYEGVETRYGQIRADGSGEETIISEEGLILSAVSGHSDNGLHFVATAPNHPREVYRLDASSDKLMRITESNPYLNSVAFARQSVVEYEAQDGLELQGLLIWPLDYEEGERYPLIVGVHGGPEAHYSNGWLSTYSLPGQVAAAEGYFMFFPNYRGSTGRGVEFTLSSQGRPAKEEFSDIVDGVDYLIDAGLVDGDRVGITGGSYGGYATAWGATYYTERFAAAVMNVGLSDKIAMLGTSDIAQELYLVHYRTWPWENWDLYREASPIYYAEQAKTPILIMHGAADPRVDPTQSRILYRYLILQDDPPPVRLVLYPGEGHGNQRAASRWDYSLRLMRWMNHYLKGEGGQPPPYQLDYGLENGD